MYRNKVKILFLLFGLLFLSSCATLKTTNVDYINNRNSQNSLLYNGGTMMIWQINGRIVIINK